MIRRSRRRPSLSPSAERWRDVAGAVGRIEPGARNAITDVPGVRVGHARAASGQRTGVTVVAPPLLPAAAGVATVNGVGELTAKLEIEELGLIQTPVYLCGTHAVGTVYQAAVRASGRGPDDAVIPVVGECDDGDMADSRTLAEGDVERAMGQLGADVGEGNVGAGSGMICFDFPGGIGTASRAVGAHHVGVLLLCNFGDRRYLDVLGSGLAPAAGACLDRGSCIAVCATDAPLSPHALRRLALRPLLGLARVGSYASDGSGEIGVAFATPREPAPADQDLDQYFAAAYEAAQEAVYNCLVAGRPAERLDGTMQEAFPIDAVRHLAEARADLPEP
jgi:D-aminopeptidase